jgi:hypothetical protein
MAASARSITPLLPSASEKKKTNVISRREKSGYEGAP